MRAKRLITHKGFPVFKVSPRPRALTSNDVRKHNDDECELHTQTRKRRGRGKRLPATALLAPEITSEGDEASLLARQIAGLGYPGFAHLRALRANPAAVVLHALVQKDLAVRLAESLPWILLSYPDLDWTWLVKQAKLQDAQNRLGFVVALAKNVAGARLHFRSALKPLSAAEKQLERARLAREDTLGRASMPAAERRWLKTNRSRLARHWKLLTGLTADQLSYDA